MSAKWRALQHRHRYTYGAIVFPPYFTDGLDRTSYDSVFFAEVMHLASLNSTYSQLEHVKKVASAFSSLLSDPLSDTNMVSVAAKSYLEIFFLENSLPLHRTLASPLAKCKNFRSLIEDCFRQLCEEYGGRVSAINGKRFCVSRAALSIMSTPKLGYMVDVVDQNAPLVALDVVLGLQSVLDETNNSFRPSPIVMEQCQEALSCMYYLLQRYPGKFSNLESEKIHDTGISSLRILEMTFLSILGILRSNFFTRDCLVAAGVSLIAALLVCLSNDEVAIFIMQGVFHQSETSDNLSAVLSKIRYRGNFLGEIRKFSPLSRLCLIRGILTAVPRAVLDIHCEPLCQCLNECTCLNGFRSSGKTILYDAILPEICIYAENPTDSHSNFHALTVMQICLQQIKTLIHSRTDGLADDYNPISVEMESRILKIVWINLDDPLNQTVKQAHLIFDLYLDIQHSLKRVGGGDSLKLFLRNIASNFLSLGPRCKGRYVPLASLTRRLGAKTILGMSENLLSETIQAYIDDDLCCAATTFLKCLLECLRDEYWNSDGVVEGFNKYRGKCLLPFLQELAFGPAKLRSNLTTYVLPVLLDLDMDSIFYMLSLIGIGCEEGASFSSKVIGSPGIALGLKQQVAALISLLKVSRVLAFLEGDMDWCSRPSAHEGEAFELEESNLYVSIVIRGIKVEIPVKWLTLALSSIDESLRMDAAESIFLNPKTASLPSSFELSLMRKAVPLNMRCCSTSFQMKWKSLFRRFFSRAHTALERQFKLETNKAMDSGDTSSVSQNSGADKMPRCKAGNLVEFLKWLSCFLFFSCYPSAPYERKIMAMELILTMIDIWPVSSVLQEHFDSLGSKNLQHPYSRNFNPYDSTLLLVGSIVDSWDRLRESSFRILLHFPTPLPGIFFPDDVHEAVLWAKKLICSPRVRESDAGALTMRLIFRKYVLDLSWVIKPLSDTVNVCSAFERQKNANEPNASSSAVMVYLASLVDWLSAAVGDAEKNLAEACKNSFVHGILLTIRYAFEELNWDSNAILNSPSEMKRELERLLDLVLRITSLALGVVSSGAFSLSDEMVDEVDGDGFVIDVQDDAELYGGASEIDCGVTGLDEEMRHSEQIVMVGCWLAMKEVSLLLGTIIRKAPLPNSVEMVGTDLSSIAMFALDSEDMLSLKQLETIGNHFLEVLLKMKHNGAVDKTRAGFTALCNRLLCSNNPRLCQLTESWMDLLMERTVAEGQTVDDLLRRSAGIPAAYVAFFLAEPQGTPKVLLPRALCWLLDVIKKFLTGSPKANGSRINTRDMVLSSNKEETSCSSIPNMNDNKETSKFRDEGVVPTVHAFNVLRASFNDTNLATDTSGFCAEALMLSIRSFSSSYWEIRNSACLAYTALVRRMIGFLNVHRKDNARRALTVLEFFHRYPSLHSFFLDELKMATKLLIGGPSDDLKSVLKTVVHPSLCPLLILLSRLKPSPISSEAGDPLDPSLLMPFIRSCSVQSNFRIRVLASRALVSLVAYRELEAVMFNMASKLPLNKDLTVKPSSSNSLSVSGAFCSFNFIHGVLLQLNSLVDINCRNLTDSCKKDNILLEMINIISKRSWIGRPQLCPCPMLNSCMVKLLDTMLTIARTCESSQSASLIWNLLWDLSSDCLDLRNSDGHSCFDPTAQELQKQAATSYFNCVMQTSTDIVEKDHVRRCPAGAVCENVNFTQFKDVLLRCMSHKYYEARIATFKWLLLSLRMWGSNPVPSLNECYSAARKACLTDINLQDIIMELLLSEKHPKCLQYILKIFYTWNSLDFVEANESLEKSRCVVDLDYRSVLKLWNMLVSIFKITRHAKTRQALICCMGVCTRRISSLCLSFLSAECIGIPEVIEAHPSNMFSDLYEPLCYFVDVIEQTSDASESVNIRKAAAESIVASGLLTQTEVIGSLVTIKPISYTNLPADFKPDEAIVLYAQRVLDLWSTSIKLLEDEDAGLRKTLALDVQKCFTARKPKDLIPGEMVSTQVEKVIESCFQHLSVAFRSWPCYVNYLCCWIMNAANNAIYTISEGDLVRRVFDKEIDNYHEEKLLICQICCSHLEDIIFHNPSSGESQSKFIELLHTWREKFFEQLTVFTNDFTEKRISISWFGGIGNHKDAFLPVFANLVAIYALSNSILKVETGNVHRMLSEVSALGETIRCFFSNSLISNLYLLLLKSHEKHLETGAESLAQHFELKASALEEFNPYFLLG